MSPEAAILELLHCEIQRAIVSLVGSSLVLYVPCTSRNARPCWRVRSSGISMSYSLVNIHNALQCMINQVPVPMHHRHSHKQKQPTTPR